MPKAVSAICKAPVQLEVAKAYLTPIYFANLFSRSAIKPLYFLFHPYFEAKNALKFSFSEIAGPAVKINSFPIFFLILFHTYLQELFTSFSACFLNPIFLIDVRILFFLSKFISKALI